MRDYEKFKSIFEEEEQLRIPVELLGSEENTSLWTDGLWLEKSYHCIHKYLKLETETENPSIKKLAKKRSSALLKYTIFYTHHIRN